MLQFAPASLTLSYAGADGIPAPLGANGSSPYNFPAKQWYAIHVEVRGAQIAATVDTDRLRISASDARLTHGGLAFIVDPNSYILFDDIKVSAYEP